MTKKNFRSSKILYFLGEKSEICQSVGREQKWPVYRKTFGGFARCQRTTVARMRTICLRLIHLFSVH